MQELDQLSDRQGRRIALDHRLGQVRMIEPEVEDGVWERADDDQTIAAFADGSVDAVRGDAGGVRAFGEVVTELGRRVRPRAGRHEGIDPQRGGRLDRGHRRTGRVAAARGREVDEGERGKGRGGIIWG